MRTTVRMYDVGFGDCFLLGFQDSDETRWVLIDCGTITEGRATLSRIVDDVLETCRNADGEPELALVVATHRHKDHVWGFTDARWAQVRVGEVWMPWTEDPNDPEATHIRERQSALALALAGKPSDDNPLEDAPDGETERRAHSRRIAALALNALTNEAAMRTLHDGFAPGARRRFLPEKRRIGLSRTLAGLPGVTFHILGPPRDKKALALMDPPEGKGYLRWPTRIPRRKVGPPFAERYCIRGRDYVPLAAGATFARSDRSATRKAVDEPAGLLGAALDKAVNNTSLVMMIEAGGRHLLFTGDAQWGSWQAMLEEPGCRAVLAKTSMLKVGHHGSHNATPKALIEEVVPGPITALFSTKAVPQWPNIPRAPLLAELRRRRGVIARTDAATEVAGAAFRIEPGLYIEWSC